MIYLRSLLQWILSIPYLLRSLFRLLTQIWELLSFSLLCFSFHFHSQALALLWVLWKFSSQKNTSSRHLQTLSICCTTEEGCNNEVLQYLLKHSLKGDWEGARCYPRISINLIISVSAGLLLTANVIKANIKSVFMHPCKIIITTLAESVSHTVF